MFSRTILFCSFSALVFSCGRSLNDETSNLASNQERSEIHLFEAGQNNPKTLPINFTINKNTRDKNMARSDNAQQILTFFRENQALFSVPISKQDLRERVVPNSTSIRFQQFKNNVPIEGAEIVCIFWQDAMSLKALNSSIIDASSLNEQPDITEGKALKIAQEFLQKEKNNLSQEPLAAGSLVFVQEEKAPSLVWRITFPEAIVDVNAQGPEAGSIIKTRGRATEAFPNIKIFNAELIPLFPTDKIKGILVLENGQKSNDAKLAEKLGYKAVTKDAMAAQENFQKTVEFYRDNFQRLGYDGQEGSISVSVEVQKHNLLDIAGLKQNAAWVENQNMFIFGAGGDKLAGFAQALDVVGHEFTHAVVSYSSKLIYEKEPGALNEHLADVFGELLQEQYQPEAPRFLIGESVLRGEFAQKASALRDMQNPDQGLIAQPGRIDEIPEEYGANCQPGLDNDNCGVHLLNGIPNRAATGIILALGKDKASRLFYDVMINRLRANSDFNDYRNQVIDECQGAYTKAECRAVREAFTQVGL